MPVGRNRTHTACAPDWGARDRTWSWTSKVSRAGLLHHSPTEHVEPRSRYYDAPVTAPTVVILAAGEGTRMRSAVPKLLHPLCGRPIVAWPVAAAREAGAARVVVV